MEFEAVDAKFPGQSSQAAQHALDQLEQLIPVHAERQALFLRLLLLRLFFLRFFLLFRFLLFLWLLFVLFFLGEQLQIDPGGQRRQLEFPAFICGVHAHANEADADNDQDDDA